MQCKGCKYPDTHVVKSYKDDVRDMVVRRRECLRCGIRFNTSERKNEIKSSDDRFQRSSIK